MTYAKVLAEAKSKVDLADLGITELRFRRAATGARILEVPGATSGDKADSLAEKLREALKEEDIKIAMPTKCSEVRVSGLDDSVSAEEVAKAIIKIGGCRADLVKVGEIRVDHTGLGTIWVRCPVAVAKKVADSGRLLVGWVAAQVKLMQTKPLRCYRCLEMGHVRVKCTAEVDRSNQCYRCGQPDHKAGQCSAAPHCTVCAAANKPSEHRVGSQSCGALPTKDRRKGATGAKAQSQPVHPAAIHSLAREEKDSMEVQ